MQRVASAPWDRTDEVEGLRRQVATIEALMLACNAPPILITLVEDLYRSIDSLSSDHSETRSPEFGQPPSLLDAG